MPVGGRKPKPQGQAVTRHQQTHEWTEVANVPFKNGRKLPQRRTNGRLYPSAVREMWKAWSTMPHCIHWTASDWAFALTTIELAALFEETGESKFATELRNREKVLGTTVDFRRDLRVRYVDAPKPEKRSLAPAAGVTNIADFRNL